SRARAGPTEGMTPESGPSLLRRVRWGNLARLGAALAALAPVLAWPRLRPREPRLPPATVAPAPAPVQVGSGEVRARRGPRVDERRGGRGAGPRGAGPRPAERRRAERRRAERRRAERRRMTRATRRQRGRPRRAKRSLPARARPPIPRATTPPPPRPATPPPSTTAPQEFVFG